MDDIKLFAENEKDLETLIRGVRIYSQDKGMEFGIYKYVMLVIKVANDIYLTEWNYQIKTRLERTQKRKSTNTWACWRLTPSNKSKWKTKFKKNIPGELENYLRQNSCRNLIKEINTWAVPLVRYSGPFFKWTRDEFKQMDQRAGIKWQCISHYIPETTFTDNKHQEKSGAEDLPTLNTALTHRYNDSNIIYKNTMEESLQPLETIRLTRWTTELQ